MITRTLSGEASADEEKELHNWLEKDPAHRALFDDLKAAWEENPRGAIDTPFFFSLERGLQRLRSGLVSEDPGRQRDEALNLSDESDEARNWRDDGEKELEKRGSPGAGNGRQPGEGGEIRLFRGGDSSFGRKRSTSWWLAAALVLMALTGSLYIARQLWEDPVTRFETSRLEQRILTLPDGSIARLNQSSWIEFRKDLIGEKREIRMGGEVFFEVNRNPGRPFVVQTEEAEIRVLGTSFNVREIRSDLVQVAVRDGLVSIRHREQREEVELSMGQLGLIASGGSFLDPEENSIDNYLGWMSGSLSFDRMPFSRVLHQLKNLYGVESELADPGIGDLPLTIYTERMVEQEVIRIIALALGLRYERIGNRLVWSRDEESN